VINVDCSEVRPLLYRFAEAGLLADDTAAVAEHLAGCASCMERQQRIAALDELAMAAEDEQPDDRLRHALLSDYRRVLSAKRAGRRSWHRRMRPVLRAAAVAIIAAGSGTATWLTLRDRPGSTETAPPASVSFDHLFPLEFTNAYNVTHEDGRQESGAHVVLVQ
jgi:anti-sigma factor RsiW